MGGSNNRNRDIILLLEIALDVCEKMVEVQKQEQMDSLSFNFNSEQNFCSTKYPFADNLFACIYKAHENRNATDDIILFYLLEDSEKNITKRCKKFQTPFTSLCFQKMDKQNEGQLLKELSDDLNYDFLSQKKINKLQKLLDEFLSLRKQLENMEIPFPKYEQIESYLDKYYQILTYLMVNEEMIKESATISQILGILLHLDQEEGSISLLSPMALNSVRKMYLCVDQYYRKLLGEYGGDQVLSLFYRNVIIKKVQHTFRWFIQKEGKFFHAAVAPYKEEISPNGNLLVQVRDINSYNSFEGIGELRVAEKILYEFQKYINSDLCQNAEKINYNVAIFGDLNKEPLKELCDFLEGNLRRINLGNKEVLLVIHAYSKNFSEIQQEEKNEQHIRLLYHNDLNKFFENREKVKNLLLENRVVFMLDCVKLYRPIGIERSKDIIYLKQKFVYSSSIDMADGEKLDFCKPNLMDKLYEIMMVYHKEGIFGTLQKVANDAFLGFCEKEIKEIPLAGSGLEAGHHTLYVYVSDLNAFEKVYCNDQYFLRTERYNQKKIGIIRYTNADTEERNLPLACKDSGAGNSKMLCFNIWQVVKHIALEERDKIINGLLEDIISLRQESVKEVTSDLIKDYDLSQMLIGIDYQEWPEKLTFYYALQEEIQSKYRSDILLDFLKKFIKRIIEPIFNDKQEDIFRQYFWKAFYSLLYGDAGSVQDMLFIHLLQNCPSFVGTAMCASENNEEQVVKNVNRDYKYSIKRFYAKIMKDFDISAENSFDQMRTSYSIDKNIEGGKEELFRNVIEVCKQMDYKHNYLYKNCLNTLEKF